MEKIHVGWQISDWDDVLDSHNSPEGSHRSKKVYKTKEQAIEVAKGVMEDLHMSHTPKVQTAARFPHVVEYRPLSSDIEVTCPEDDQDYPLILKLVTFEYRIVEKTYRTITAEVDGETFSKNKEEIQVIQDWSQVMVPSEETWFGDKLPDTSYVWKRSLQVVEVVYEVIEEE